MARIRTIKPEFFTSEQVAECSPNARLLFVGMWVFCDDQGVHPASNARLKMEVFPGDDFTRDDIGAMVNELVSAGLLTEYEVDGQKYWLVTGWKHQKIDKPSKKYPLPASDDSPRVRRKVADRSGTDVDVEGKGSKELSEGDKSPSSSPAAPEDGQGNEAKPEKPNPAARLAQVTDDATEAYNAICAKPAGLMPKATAAGRQSRQQQVKRVVDLARSICAEQYGDPVITRKFWDDYLAAVQADDFHSGRQGGGKGHDGWTPDFEYITQRKTMLRVYERAGAEA